MGSFVPADSADMYCLDGVYTRMGAGDDLAADMSTFMVRDVCIRRLSCARLVYANCYHVTLHAGMESGASYQQREQADIHSLFLLVDVLSLSSLVLVCSLSSERTPPGKHPWLLLHVCTLVHPATFSRWNFGTPAISSSTPPSDLLWSLTSWVEGPVLMMALPLLWPRSATWSET